jgi:hypothetical protein
MVPPSTLLVDRHDPPRLVLREQLDPRATTLGNFVEASEAPPKACVVALCLQSAYCHSATAELRSDIKLLPSVPFTCDPGHSAFLDQGGGKRAGTASPSLRQAQHPFPTAKVSLVRRIHRTSFRQPTVYRFRRCFSFETRTRKYLSRKRPARP